MNTKQPLNAIWFKKTDKYDDCTCRIIIFCIKHGKAGRNGRSLEDLKPEQQSIRTMNKLILLCFISAFLLALAAASKESRAADRREARHAGRNTKTDNFSGQEKRKQERQAARRQEARKEARKESAKKSLKNKRKSDNKRKVVKKQEKKDQREAEKKQKRKEEKRTAKKEEKRTEKRTEQRQADSCVEEGCLEMAQDYFKLLTSRVRNYETQAARIERFADLSGKKAAKASEFGTVVDRIRAAGGGNASNLQCNGVSGNSGADTLTELYTNLTACDADIMMACSTDLPVINATVVDACSEVMTNYTVAVEACADLAGSDACMCWATQELMDLQAEVKLCDLSTKNKEMKVAKKVCVEVFGACRKLEDASSAALSACMSSNSASALTSAITQGLENAAAASDLTTKINSTVTASSRQASPRSTNITCATFLTGCQAIPALIAEGPLLAGVKTALDTLTSSLISGWHKYIKSVLCIFTFPQIPAATQPSLP